MQVHKSLHAQSLKGSVSLPALQAAIYRLSTAPSGAFRFDVNSLGLYELDSSVQHCLACYDPAWGELTPQKQDFTRQCSGSSLEHFQKFCGIS